MTERVVVAPAATGLFCAPSEYWAESAPDSAADQVSGPVPLVLSMVMLCEPSAPNVRPVVLSGTAMNGAATAWPVTVTSTEFPPVAENVMESATGPGVVGQK